MTRREKWEQLPLQAHFYPMPAMAYIEDSATRITLATKQPLGVASLSSGQLEVCNLSDEDDQFEFICRRKFDSGDARPSVESRRQSRPESRHLR